jgi:hypothetical protein
MRIWLAGLALYLGAGGMALAASYAPPYNSSSVNITGGTIKGPTITQAPNALGASPVLAPDGSTQAIIGWVPGNTNPNEVPVLLPGIYGAGATLLCNSSAQADVDCNIVPQGAGNVNIGNGSGTLAKFLDPGDEISGYFTFKPAIVTSARPNTLTITPVAQQGVTQLHVKIDTIQGGFAAGHNLVAGGYGSTTFGLNSQSFGQGSFVSGNQGYDFNGFGVRCHSSAPVASLGSNQVCEQTLQRNITDGSARRLTADGGSGVTNTLSVPFRPNGHGTWKAAVECTATVAGGTTVVGDTATWLVNGSYTTFPSTLSFPYSTGGGASLVTTGSLSTATLAATADTTNNNLSVQVTPPVGNTGTIACDAYVRWMGRLS